MFSLSSAIIAAVYAPLISVLSGSGGLIHGSTSVAPNFHLHQNIVGKDFFTAFRWETFNDPTHGHVNYVDQRTALAKNLTFATDRTFIMRPDFQSVLPPNVRGRDSNRISSTTLYRDSVVVLDVQHVPASICSVWPAFWTVTAGRWPDGGEIDIYEGVNNNEANLGSLHTTPGCTMIQNRKQTGQTKSTDCDAFVDNNRGCGTQFTQPNSFGSSLNAVGGGWFVMKRTNDDISIWFWRRGSSVPASISQGNAMISPDASWGTPDATFPSSSTCNIGQHFDDHMIVFDTTFCGDWAGSQFGASGCQGNCEDFVNNNPAAFKDAFWEINALRVYTPGPQGLIL